MTSRTIGRLLLVALAVVGPAFTVSLVSAHGNETTTDDAPPYDGTIADWAGGWKRIDRTHGPGCCRADGIAHGHDRWVNGRGYG